jgi:hypothetical protein
MANVTKTVRNLTLADAALAFARDRLAAQLPGVKPKRRRPGARSLLIGGAVAAAAGALLLKRDKLAGLVGGGPTVPDPVPAPPGFKPVPETGPSNYDAPGPPANTATAVPVPEAWEPPAIDEAAEEAAAAAEAANIGGQVSDYAGTELGETATEAERPLMEAGEGEGEGQEQAEAELAAAAEPTAPGESPEQHQIEDVLDSPPEERIEPLVSEEPSGEPGSEWRTWSGRSINP